MKTCTKCGDTKPLDGFGKDAHKSDGLCSHCKACKNAASKSWQSANTERVRENVRKWAKANRDHINELQRAWKKKHPDRGAVYQEKWRQLHPEKASEWAKKHPERMRAATRRWNERNPESAAIINRNSKLMRKGVPGAHTKADIDRLLVLQRGKCAACAIQLSKAGYHRDHILPIALGGDNSAANIQLLCPTCNLQKNAKHPVDFMRQHGRLL